MRMKRCVEGRCLSSTIWLRRSHRWERGQDGADEGIAPQRRDDIPGKLRRHPHLGHSGPSSQMRGCNHAPVGEEALHDGIVPDGFLSSVDLP
jgi:hypothetical protein